jgi:hypothetical protein
MALDDPVILTCAISGALADRAQCPAIPYTPGEYAAEARRIVDEGGVHIHIHARRPDGTPSHEVEDFAAITEAILAEVDDVIVNFSTGALGVPSGRRAWMWIITPPSSTIRRASAAYSAGVYGIAGHWSRLASAPEIAQVMMTGSSRLTARGTLAPGDDRTATARTTAAARVLRAAASGQ